MLLYHRLCRTHMLHTASVCASETISCPLGEWWEGIFYILLWIEKDIEPTCVWNIIFLEYFALLIDLTGGVTIYLILTNLFYCEISPNVFQAENAISI